MFQKRWNLLKYKNWKVKTNFLFDRVIRYEFQSNKSHFRVASKIDWNTFNFLLSLHVRQYIYIYINSEMWITKKKYIYIEKT